MSQAINLSTSFVQPERHASKSAKFQAVKPQGIAEVLNDYGYDLVKLKTGVAINPDRKDHQTTVAVYRHRDQFEVKGLHFDLIFKVPHLYGSIIASMGMFRIVCLNGLIVGKAYEQARIKHLGNPYEQINQLIPTLVAQRAKLVQEVQSMQAIQLNAVERYALAIETALSKIGNTEKVMSIQAEDLLKPRRNEDQATDLFTVMNTIQENILRHGVRYTTSTFNGNTAGGMALFKERNMSTRKVQEYSVNALGITAQLWDRASKIVNERKAG